MSQEDSAGPGDADRPGHRLWLSLAAGGCRAVIGGAFRWVLRWADVHRSQLVIHPHHAGPFG
jgi:hypothetical protein